MRRLVIATSVLALVGVGLYAWHVAHASEPTPTFAARPMMPLPMSMPSPQMVPMHSKYPKHIGPTVASKIFDPMKKYPPGTYVPRGFMPDFRQRIVADFDKLITERLGPDFPQEKRAQVAAAQNALWDAHGPAADLFREGQMSQPAFAEETHEAFAKFADDLGKVFTDEEYEKVLNVRKGDDPYYALFHSRGEQPGLAFQNGPADSRPLGSPPTMSVKPDPTPPRWAPGTQPPTPTAPFTPVAPAPGGAKYAH